MEPLEHAIYNTPIIDHHAHNILTTEKYREHNALSIFTEASGPALEDVTSTMPFLRGVQHLSCILGCENAWDAVKPALCTKHRESPDEWAKECFSGIETALIDDGFDDVDTHPYDWHDQLVRSRCKRLVRIEVVAEEHIESAIKAKLSTGEQDMTRVVKSFEADIEKAVRDPEVAGFKSVICYRTGLAVPAYNAADASALDSLSLHDDPEESFWLQHDALNPFFVHLTARILQRLDCKKPFQFHTGLGDVDMMLALGNPTHLQPFMDTYPGVIIVLLHASYPFTKDAGYLATVYKNVYLDIGEVFPLSR